MPTPPPKATSAIQVARPAPAAPTAASYLESLRSVNLQMIQASSNAPDRQKFNDMLHALGSLPALSVIPFSPRDEIAYHASFSAVVYANLVRGARLVYQDDPAVKVIAEFLEWLLASGPDDRELQGDQGIGYTFRKKAL